MSVQREQISAKYTVTTLLGHTHVAVVLVSSLTPLLEVHVSVSITIDITYTLTTLRLSFTCLWLNYCDLYLQISMNAWLALTTVSNYVTIQ